MKIKSLLNLCLLLLISGTVAAQESGNYYLPVQATISNGTIEGNYDVDSRIAKYFGIPFAKPPVGDLRWKAPQAADNWENVKETKKFGPRPVQANVFGDMNSWSDGLSEDCLYLNVWTPAKRGEKGLPVLFYIYGGGFVAGDASEPRYNGESMAKEGVVVVTANHRLNIFGFLSHPELSAESPYKASGNYGLLDQAMALQWVKDNIDAFGGDPDKITIAGESAGSISVSYQMASPLSRNLIAGAIGESGAGIYPTLAPVSLEEAEKTGKEFLEGKGVKSLAELRKMSTKDIFEMYTESGRFGFPVVLDGHFLDKNLPEIFEAKEQAQVPLLLGWNTAEMNGMAFMQGKPYTKENFIEKVKEAYPEDHEEVLKLYPHATADEVAQSATDLASDRFISYSTWKWFDLHRKNSAQPVYRYLFGKLRPPLVDKSLTSGFAGGTVRAENPEPAPKAIGAPHAMEIEYAMGNLHLVKDYEWTAEDYKVSNTMFGYFTNFVKTGNPNGENLPEWPKATDASNPEIINIDVDTKSEKAEKDARFKFHDRFFKQ
ncbi:carboxylesterase/lipase family protein [Mongoliibacter ruber]|uniref:Carboxylic ester hydrolase n=1 Tax=Mongoliibacter ruber TaxID=1750599 RepID=A0A2T0WSW3_9BACT|nr:carboxylesterase family protein [Mongoliibacter ruber]PRY89767.1 para-nitrobenzyl esterase [Mongoliibacter ruber]